MKKIFLLHLLLCLSSVSVVAQSKLKKADKLFECFSYIDAAKLYEEYLSETKNPSIKTLKNAADSYYKIDDMRNALKWYQKVYDIQGKTMSDIYFLRYIQSMKVAMNYEKANNLTKEYLVMKGDQKQINHFLSQKKNNDSTALAKQLYSIKNLNINSKYADFGTVFYGDKMIFTSGRVKGGSNKLYNWNKEPFLNLYVADRNGEDGSFISETLFLPDIMSKFHEATATFTPDLKTIYFTTNIVIKKKVIVDESRTNNFQIKKGQIVDGKLINSEGVKFNSTEYSVGHPSLSEDGRWLFFASDMPGGYGETDLYVIRVDEDGTMGTPINLGPTINTIGNELFPFFRNGTLYFSSDGHFGWGDLDVYQSKFSVDMSFSEPVNLGSPINSNKDDFCYIIDDSETYGYISSNRAGGVGSDDIYSFKKAKPDCDQKISGKVINFKTKVPIENASITVLDIFGDTILKTISGSGGKYDIVLPCNKKFKLIATKNNHSKDEKEVVTKEINGDEIKNVDFELSNFDDLIVKVKGQEKIDINPIFFDYDKSNVTKEAAIELDKVVFTMEKFPTIKIKIESHTDSRGKDNYNMKLSDDRAKSTQAYIISKGIDASRIESAIGYGESRLMNRCENGIKCTDIEHFENRRSDFIITQK